MTASPFTICIVSLIALAPLGLPIGLSMIGASIFYLAIANLDLATAAEQILNGLYNSYVLLAVAAAVIGGTSLFGGRGKTIHGVLGGLVIGGIYNGLYLMGVSSEWIDVVVAGVLLAAALIDVLSRRGATGQA